uniref:Uncharacterized protein n=1 Tax=Anguilla anguilla TaxID=7936 RepID=A0A0E9U8D1_ANGAN
MFPKEALICNGTPSQKVRKVTSPSESSALDPTFH